MLEKKIVQLAVQGLTQEDTPAFVRASCLNTKQRKVPCTVCVDICPVGALTPPAGQGAAWDKCIGCSLCVVRCPAGAIAPSYEDFKRVLRLVTTKRETRMLACEKSASEHDFGPWCLGVIPWELLASLALSGKVVVERAGCKGCEREGHLADFDQALARARQFAGEAFFDARVTLLEAGDTLPPIDLTRREALRSLSRGARTGVGAILPDTRKLDNNPLFIRRLLQRQVRDSLENESLPQAFTWATPVVDAGLCWACGICESICPHQALVVYLSKEEDRRYLLHYPDRCTQCGLCQSICPDKAITGFGYGALPARAKFFINPALTTHCSQCGGPVKPGPADTLCTRCQASQRKRK